MINSIKLFRSYIGAITFVFFTLQSAGQHRNHYVKVKNSNIILNDEDYNFQDAYLINNEIWFTCEDGKIGVLIGEEIVPILNERTNIISSSIYKDSLFSVATFTDSIIRITLIDIRTKHTVKVCKFSSDIPLLVYRIVDANNIVAASSNKIVLFNFSDKITKKEFNVDQSYYWDIVFNNSSAFFIGHNTNYLLDFQLDIIQSKEFSNDINRISFDLVYIGGELYRYTENSNSFDHVILNNNDSISLTPSFQEVSPYLMSGFSLLTAVKDNKRTYYFFAECRYLIKHDEIIEFVLVFSKKVRRRLKLQEIENTEYFSPVKFSSVVKQGNYVYFFDPAGVIYKLKLRT